MSRIRWSKLRDPKTNEIVEGVGISDCRKYTLVQIAWAGEVHYSTYFGKELLDRGLDRDAIEQVANDHKAKQLPPVQHENNDGV